MDPHASFVAGWGTLSLINAGLAQAKRRSGLAWWFLSLLLGPAATFFIVILDPAPASSGQQPVASGESDLLK